MIRIVAAIAAAMVLGACGHSGACPVECNAPKAFDVLVTEKDHAVMVHRGDKIELVLHAKSGMTDWSGVTVDDPAVLRAVPTGITAVRGVTVAGFEAAAPGTATIRATAGPLCSPGQACPQFEMLFEVTVSVT